MSHCKHRWGEWGCSDMVGVFERRCLDCGKIQKSQNVMWSNRASKFVRSRR